ncbi:hypothetical protein [Puia sp.]|jgi:hypothetical protein|uniref:hypothetical protein n=1 Tax=Puia sp. TaxID=2045100 RepID=UPI002F3EFCD6
MKWNTLFLAATTLFIVAAGCKKNKDDNNSSNSIVLSATIGGSFFKPGVNNAIYGTLSRTYILGGSTINNGDSALFTLVLTAPFSLNTDLGTSGKAAITYQYAGKKYLSGPGSGPLSCKVISLDSVNHKIAGNFSGTLFATSNRDSLAMTNGSFDATYSVVNNF